MSSCLVTKTTNKNCKKTYDFDDTLSNLDYMKKICYAYYLVRYSINDIRILVAASNTNKYTCNCILSEFLSIIFHKRCLPTILLVYPKNGISTHNESESSFTKNSYQFDALRWTTLPRVYSSVYSKFAGLLNKKWH